jgi:hypothetical protein
LITAVLRRHPVFQAETVQYALTMEPPDPGEVFEGLARAVNRITPEQLRLGLDGLKRSERDKLLANAMITLVLTLAVRDRWPLDRFVDSLYAHVWRRPGKPASRDPKVLLADTKTPETLAVVADVFMTRTNAAMKHAEQSEEYSRQAVRRAFEAETAADERKRELDKQVREREELLVRLDELETALSSEQRNRVVDRSHHVDDFESLRTRVIRMLERQGDLLSDGLHALRHGSTTVTDEYLERAIDALHKERDQLKSQGAADQ